MKTLGRNGFTLNYDILGESTSGETVLFFNGSLSTMAGWSPLTETLIKDGGRALLHDMRGQLYSPWNKPFSFSDLADDAAAILDKEGIKKAHIAGLSYGSIPAQVFAASYPERTESLILISALSEMDANTEAWVHRFIAWGKAACSRSIGPKGCL